MPTVALAVMGYRAAMPMILESVNTVREGVDEVVVTGDDFTDDDTAQLQALGCNVFIEPWHNHFGDYKNRLLSHVTTDWVCCCDHDEIPTEEMANNLKQLVDESEDSSLYNIVGFDGINETTMLDGTLQQSRGTGKELLHETVYNCYHGEVHIWLNQHAHAWKGIRAPYAYRHLKTELEMIERAIRNVWLGGGGDTWKEGNPLWNPLRNICTDIGIHDYKEFLRHLREDESLDERLMNWIENANKQPWHDGELKMFLKYRLLYYT
jgi:glycosyltransferase involved in cell wall biosynthesis